MAIRQIRVLGDDVLRKKCKEVKEMTPRMHTLVEDMYDTMYEAMGVGLAAPQVGILKRIVVIDTGEEGECVTLVLSLIHIYPGGSLSAADVFTYLYFVELNVDPKNPKDENRDRFVLSKGHVAPGYYSTLAERGFFPKEDLLTLRHVGSYLQGHPDMKKIPGVDMSSGSLGQGISAAVGMALAAKLQNKDYRTYTLLGDGEIQEGQVWEAAM